MPVPTPAVAALLTLAQVRSVHHAPPPPPDIVVRAPTYTLAADGTVTYSHGVTAQYDVTTIFADTLVVDQTNHHAQAIGHVRVVDPDLTMSADDLEFTWDPGKASGHGLNIDARLGGALLQARTVEYANGVYTLGGVKFTTCRRTIPSYLVESRSVTAVPGNYIRIVHPRLTIFGTVIQRLPNAWIRLDNRSNGLGFPAVSYRSGSGFGIAYAPEYLLNRQTLVQSVFDAYHGAMPRYGIQATHTFVPAGQANQGHIAPISDIDSRLGYGYFDDIVVNSPDDEYAFEREARNSVSLGSQVNEGVAERLPGGSITKAVEAIYEIGGRIGEFGEISHLRFQDVRPEGQSQFATRFEVDSSLQPAPIQFARDFETDLRLDTQGFAGGQLYGWIRSQLGVAYVPRNEVRLAAAYVSAWQAGNPGLTIDQLYTAGGLYVRADFNLKATQASYLIKFTDGWGIYDKEYRISQAVGCLRAGVTYRQFPSDFRFGVELRLDSIMQILERRMSPRTSTSGDRG